MKPYYIRFQAFGPYVNQQYVDFDQLRQNGLFLICGETGSGKTTILDAITYALYGRSSGSSRGSIDKMRCNQAPDNLPTEVEYVFEVLGKVYKFTRSVKKGTKVFTTNQNSMVRNKEGVFEPLHENPTQTIIDGTSKVPGDAEKIIGLSYEQFCQVIVLPQGKFERLLIADSAEKEAILVSIFKAEAWQQLSEQVYEKAKNVLDGYLRESEHIQTKLNEYECHTLDELKSLLESKKNDLVSSENKQETTQKELTKLTSMLDELNQIKHKFVQLKDKQRLYLTEQEKQESINQLKNDLAKAEKADQVKDEVTAYNNAKLTHEKSESEVKQAQDKLENDKKKYTQCLDEQSVFLEKEPVRIEYQEKIVQLRTSMSDYEAMTKASETLRNLVSKTSQQQKKVNQCIQKEEISHQELVEALNKQSEVDRIHNETLQNYLINISGKLAKELVDGEPCPVCGSSHHPQPKQLSDKTVTDRQLSDAENNSKKAMERVELCRAQKERCVAEREAANNEYLINQQEEKSFRVNYEALCEKKIEGIENLSDLSQMIDQLTQKVEQFDKKKETLNLLVQHNKESVTASEQLLKKAMTDHKSAKGQLTENSKKLQTALEANQIASIEEVKINSLTPEQKNKYYTQIATYHANMESLSNEIQQLMKELSDKEEPDVSHYEQQRSELSKQHQQLIAENALLRNEVEKASVLHHELTKKNSHLDENIAKARANQEFAKRLRGDTGISLQRYVLGVMLSAITKEANQLLEHVHGGRYRLYRTDDSSGSARKAGLELCVADTFVGEERRSVKSLSGGEKFLVALSLAIGLSTVAQKRGMKLDAMFIDEGFGTLDDSSINDALSVLGHLGQANGLVGIISHVQILRDNIPKRIEITKKRDGSTLTIV